MEESINSNESRPAAEIISIGDELTSGQRLDTNSQWLSRQFCDLGMPVRFHSTVADDVKSMREVFAVATDRADIVVATGGLGPTADDLTRQVMAGLANVELLLDQSTIEGIQRRYAARGREMPENNRQQGLFPAGSEIIPNPLGTAPGIEMEFQNRRNQACFLFALPGVPAEMKPMFESHVVPAIYRSHPELGVIVHHSLHCFGAGESDVEMLLPDLIRRGQQPAVGITASFGTITLRIAATGSREEECHSAIHPVEQIIREALGDLVFGHSGQTLPDVLIEKLRERHQTLAVVDGGVGGLAGAWLHDADPQGTVFKGGLSKFEAEDDIQSQLNQAQLVFHTDYILLIGPDSQPDQPPRRQIAVLHDQQILRHSIVPIRDSTISVEHAAKQALNFLRKMLETSD